MSNPKGNPGNKGGGRKGAYEEAARAMLLARSFFEELTEEEIKKYKENPKSLFETMIGKGLSGNMPAIIAMFNKLFPDKIDLQGQVKVEKLKKIEKDLSDIAKMCKI